jgi:hypothetical protein
MAVTIAATWCGWLAMWLGGAVLRGCLSAVFDDFQKRRNKQSRVSGNGTHADTREEGRFVCVGQEYSLIQVGMFRASA